MQTTIGTRKQINIRSFPDPMIYPRKTHHHMHTLPRTDPSIHPQPHTHTCPHSGRPGGRCRDRQDDQPAQPRVHHKAAMVPRRKRPLAQPPRRPEEEPLHHHARSVSQPASQPANQPTSQPASVRYVEQFITRANRTCDSRCTRVAHASQRDNSITRTTHTHPHTHPRPPTLARANTEADAVARQRKKKERKDVRLQKGMWIEALLRGKNPWLPAKVLCVNLDGTADVEFENGKVAIFI